MSDTLSKFDDREESETQNPRILPPDQVSRSEVDSILEVLQEEAKKHRRQRAVTNGIMFSIGGLMLLVMIVSLVMSAAKGKWDFGDFGSFFSFFALFGSMAAMSQNHKQAVSQMAKFQDIRAVGLLVEALETDDRSIKSVVKQALPVLLRRLQASDAYLLDEQQRKILNRILKKAHVGSDTELVLAILKAYEQVGDESALAEVERLAKLPPQKKVSVQKVVDAARECQPFLKTRVELVRASQTLLRASSVSDVLTSAPETLLRPAGFAGEVSSQELLRASTAADEATPSYTNQHPLHPVSSDRQAETPALLLQKGGESE